MRSTFYNMNLKKIVCQTNVSPIFFFKYYNVLITVHKHDTKKWHSTHALWSFTSASSCGHRSEQNDPRKGYLGYEWGHKRSWSSQRRTSCVIWATTTDHNWPQLTTTSSRASNTRRKVNRARNRRITWMVSRDYYHLKKYVHVRMYITINVIFNENLKKI